MTDLRVSFPTPCDEKWEAMKPSGCNRVCARCDKVIHDLSQYELEEAEALLRRAPDSCVRARIDADGVVAVKRGGGMRRMVIAAGASAGLLASQPALAGQDRPKGAISGDVMTYGFRTKVTATDTSGNSYRTTSKANGKYKLKHLPAGTYTLTFVPDCGDSWTVENVIVASSEIAAPKSPDESGCIIVGKMLIDGGAPDPKRV
ncbi:MAG: carboxypeptidase regulatory-like domain-containing protein [Sphingomonas sp.]|uniref:carboxypeptidase-like regulatory domain-containing protein n=1 Tax=Sphingomonas sp. TaxID=28214 RepID=UPI0025D685E0|nr:carboxypeptidase-like regulatory domain-containing protein [Sphingomonas sp.]MBX3563857.1 carboxypeptidase regulatory-like domain-containing protein [Sphingomonas sp.]